MRKYEKRMRYRASAALAALILAWIVAAGALYMLAQQRSAYALALAESKRAESSASTVARTEALIRDTAREREALEELVRTDVLTALEIIEEAGASAGVAVSIGGASVAEAGRGELLRSIAVVASAEGSFSALMHTLSLFETLPFLSAVESVTLERVGEGAAGRWRLSTRIRIFADASIPL
ncbi:hypothetical protein COU20_01690 [Candidatus Kaiserbacteria bacterium CG10_big_fil_rev_8_21_14_0_10_59_10]|uniref:Uncharacterized protein n=1 Tax=Candidatus Kaiserbacteria bacterium CG10_big_fil_rev_8_21_14_0_10_59_10 TaxID=1974612 RepID=A0A2H0U7U9_9BACT|nr:MAG: hypothetical protein COU20_01690 [Candidatus Kaiserbacteria bacterium CG10_big_fil_rev_8_21_14_0_10_59_10]